jgi:hypothetical protein
VIITKFIQDVTCNRYATLCVSDENEVLIWGKLYDDDTHENHILEPTTIFKAEEGALNQHDDEH